RRHDRDHAALGLPRGEPEPARQRAGPDDPRRAGAPLSRRAGDHDAPDGRDRVRAVSRGRHPVLRLHSSGGDGAGAGEPAWRRRAHRRAVAAPGGRRVLRGGGGDRRPAMSLPLLLLLLLAAAPIPLQPGTWWEYRESYTEHLAGGLDSTSDDTTRF